MTLRILQLISSLGFFGAENVLLELSAELKKLGHSATIGIFKNLHSPNLELLEKAKEYSLNTQVFECNGRFDLKTVSMISSYVKENSVDVIHSHGYKSNIYAVLSNIKNKKPLVSTCHNWINSNARMGFYTFLDKLFLKRFDAVISVSTPVKELLLKSGISPKKISLIENGVNLDRFQVNGNGKNLKKDLRLPDNRKIIGTVGRLTKEKGHTYFLKAAKKILDLNENCIFLVVGDGELREDLNEEAKSLGISRNILFTGKRDDIPDLLSLMDIFVLPSLLEGQPMALLEAMAAKRPVIATTVGDIPKILKNGELGILVPLFNPEAVADGILSCLNNLEKANQIASMAYSEVAKNYSSARMAKEYLTIYNAVIKGGFNGSRS